MKIWAEIRKGSKRLQAVAIRTLLCNILICLISEIAFCQSDQIQSFKENIQNAQDDTTRIRALYLLTYEFFNSSLDSAAIYAKECLTLGRKTESAKFQCLAHAIMGTTHMYQNRNDSAEYYYQLALSIAETSNLAQQSSALYSNFGVLYKRQELYDKSVKSYVDGLLVDEKNNNQYGIVVKKVNLSNLYSIISDDDLALKYGLEALQACEGLEHQDQLHLKSLLNNNIGTILVEQDKWDEALARFEQALAISQSIDNRNEMSRNLHNIGSTLEKMGRTEQGIPMLEQALKIRYEVGDKVGMIETHMQLGTSYGRLSSNERSRTEFAEALRFAGEIENHTLTSEIYLAMSNTDRQNENYLEALENFTLYHAHQDSVESQYDRRAYLEMQSKFQAAQKDVLIAQQELVITQQTAARSRYLAGLAVLLVGMGFLFYRYRKNQSLNSERIKNLERKHKLSALDYMMEGQEKERKRIARDLHDGLGGLLSSIKMKLEGKKADIVGANASRIVDEASEMIDGACNEVRRISHAMMPGALTQFGLLQAVEDLAEETGAGEGMKVQVLTNKDELELSEIQSVHLYRVIQEMISNALKHSQARSMSINFDDQLERLKIMVSDDGEGFDPVTVEHGGTGIGLKNIRSRVTYLDGSLELISQKGEGTTYHLAIPHQQVAIA